MQNCNTQNTCTHVCPKSHNVIGEVQHEKTFCYTVGSTKVLPFSRIKFKQVKKKKKKKRETETLLQQHQQSRFCKLDLDTNREHSGRQPESKAVHKESVREHDESWRGRRESSMKCFSKKKICHHRHANETKHREGEKKWDRGSFWLESEAHKSNTGST